MLYRIIILERPPVGTLYESIIFVSFIATLLAWMCERRNRDIIFVFLGSMSAIILGLLSFNIPSSQDSMIVLSAVLNTQFWLATHVLCITLGYAWCILVAMLSHFMLWEKSKLTISTNFSNRLKSLHTLTLISLLLTSIGTILGGIWADQSWGRFWGWDPKENGALLIVLWLTWIMHAQLSKDFSQRTLLALLAFTNVIVAMAWIGVNLLGVGLHSYGFTDGLLFSLAAFTFGEIVIISYLWSRANNSQEMKQHAQ
jgi:ABC-type transport system involved in cytochrome c biogenesis permease subunit